MDQGFYLIAREDSKRSAEIDRFRDWLISSAAQASLMPA
jgi:hypothetical protein